MAVNRKLLVAALLLTMLAQGCDFGRRFVNKPWGWGTVIPAVVCGALGATTGVIIQNNRPGCTAANIGNNPPVVVCDDKDHWKGGLIGGAIGVALCGLAGHYLFDPEPVVEAPPPPPPAPPPLEEPPLVKKRIILRGVNFDFDRFDIRPESRPVLDEAISTLQENPEIQVSVQGHTDSRGTDEYNLKLSERRANAVYRYLVAGGIDPSRMDVVGFGESRPVADNSTESGRAQNRRVELMIHDSAE